ncbi:MAG: hypothetical protein H7A21_16030 [Spirochaetales bacterium]|nr:hypothetical protein [Leptospiraceae bacterium]MCP5482947.1 hypothetical protein [Spirochaetales bacterium]MCP5484872.1 hypothetical protein [Spirochaetales bacterium]
MLSTRWKNSILVLHILITAAWTGSVVAILTLAFAKQAFPHTPTQLLETDRTILLLHDVLASNAGLLLVFTGLLFSMFTRWGFVKFYWVALKWLGLAFTFVWVLFFVAPSIAEMNALADLLNDGAAAESEAALLVRYSKAGQRVMVYCLLELLALVLLVALSVYKPWGPTHRTFRFGRFGARLFALAALLGVSFQAFTSFVLLPRLRRTPLPDYSLAAAGDRTCDYAGLAPDGLLYHVSFDIRASRIRKLRLRAGRSGHYGELAAAVVDRIEQSGSPEVQAISGATTTSRMIQYTVARAIASCERASEAPAPR